MKFLKKFTDNKVKKQDEEISGLQQQTKLIKKEGQPISNLQISGPMYEPHPKTRYRAFNQVGFGRVVWSAKYAGVSTYDFDSQNQSQYLQSQDTTALACDSNGQIWLGNANGVVTVNDVHLGIEYCRATCDKGSEIDIIKVDPQLTQQDVNNRQSLDHGSSLQSKSSRFVWGFNPRQQNQHNVRVKAWVGTERGSICLLEHTKSLTKDTQSINREERLDVLLYLTEEQPTLQVNIAAYGDDIPFGIDTTHQQPQQNSIRQNTIEQISPRQGKEKSIFQKILNKSQDSNTSLKNKGQTKQENKLNLPNTQQQQFLQDFGDYSSQISSSKVPKCFKGGVFDITVGIEKMIASGGTKSLPEISVWNSTSCEQLSTYSVKESGVANSMAIIQNSDEVPAEVAAKERLVTGHESGVVIVWSTQNWQLQPVRKIFEYKDNTPVRRLIYLKTLGIVCSGHANGHIYLWKIQREALLSLEYFQGDDSKNKKKPLNHIPVDHPEFATILFDKDLTSLAADQQKVLIVAGSSCGKVSLWDYQCLRDLAEAQHLKVQDKFQHTRKSRKSMNVFGTLKKKNKPVKSNLKTSMTSGRSSRSDSFSSNDSDHSNDHSIKYQSQNRRNNNNDNNQTHNNNNNSNTERRNNKQVENIQNKVAQQEDKNSSDHSSENLDQLGHEMSQKQMRPSAQMTRKNSLFNYLNITQESYISGQEVQIIKLLGSGSFGNVYLGSYLETPVAVKEFKQDQNDSLYKGQEYIWNAVKKEVEVLKMNHPNLLMYIGVCKNPLWLVTEYCEQGNLYDIMRQAKSADNKQLRQSMTWGRRLQIALQSATGILYLHHHNPPILHRDFKSANLLIKADWTVKVGDFGLSRVLRGSTNEVQSLRFANNPRYQAPEVIDSQNYTKTSDIYGLAIVFWELLTFKTPFGNLDVSQIGSFYGSIVIRGERPQMPKLEEVFENQSVDMQSYNEFCKLTTQCWDQDPLKRPDISTVVKELQKIIRGTIINGQTDKNEGNQNINLAKDLNIPNTQLALHQQNNFEDPSGLEKFGESVQQTGRPSRLTPIAEAPQSMNSAVPSTVNMSYQASSNLSGEQISQLTMQAIQQASQTKSQVLQDQVKVNSANIERLNKAFESLPSGTIEKCSTDDGNIVQEQLQSHLRNVLEEQQNLIRSQQIINLASQTHDNQVQQVLETSSALQENNKKQYQSVSQGSAGSSKSPSSPFQMQQQATSQSQPTQQQSSTTQQLQQAIQQQQAIQSQHLQHVQLSQKSALSQQKTASTSTSLSFSSYSKQATATSGRLTSQQSMADGQQEQMYPTYKIMSPFQGVDKGSMQQSNISRFIPEQNINFSNSVGGLSNRRSQDKQVRAMDMQSQEAYTIYKQSGYLTNQHPSNVNQGSSVDTNQETNQTSTTSNSQFQNLTAAFSPFASASTTQQTQTVKPSLENQMQSTSSQVKPGADNKKQNTLFMDQTRKSNQGSIKLTSSKNSSSEALQQEQLQNQIASLQNIQQVSDLYSSTANKQRNDQVEVRRSAEYAQQFKQSHGDFKYDQGYPNKVLQKSRSSVEDQVVTAKNLGQLSPNNQRLEQFHQNFIKSPSSEMLHGQQSIFQKDFHLNSNHESQISESNLQNMQNIYDQVRHESNETLGPQSERQQALTQQKAQSMQDAQQQPGGLYIKTVRSGENEAFNVYSTTPQSIQQEKNQSNISNTQDWVLNNFAIPQQSKNAQNFNQMQANQYNNQLQLSQLQYMQQQQSMNPGYQQSFNSVQHQNSMLQNQVNKSTNDHQNLQNLSNNQSTLIQQLLQNQQSQNFQNQQRQQTPVQNYQYPMVQSTPNLQQMQQSNNRQAQISSANSQPQTQQIHQQQLQQQQYYQMLKNQQNIMQQMGGQQQQQFGFPYMPQQLQQPQYHQGQLIDLFSQTVNSLQQLQQAISMQYQYPQQYNSIQPQQLQQMQQQQSQMFNPYIQNSQFSNMPQMSDTSYQYPTSNFLESNQADQSAHGQQGQTPNLNNKSKGNRNMTQDDLSSCGQNVYQSNQSIQSQKSDLNPQQYDMSDHDQFSKQQSTDVSQGNFSATESMAEDKLQGQAYKPQIYMDKMSPFAQLNGDQIDRKASGNESDQSQTLRGGQQDSYIRGDSAYSYNNRNQQQKNNEMKVQQTLFEHQEAQLQPEQKNQI